jgi:hypothetical protein
MKQFHDSKRQPWGISLTIGTVKRVKKLVDVDLLEISKGDPPLITRLTTDVILIADVLCAICKPEADARNVSDEQFAELLGGDGLINAMNALLEELIDFFHQLGRTENVGIIRQAQKLVTTATRLATEKVNSVDVEKLLTDLLTDQFGNASMKLPESSESIPTLSPSAS